MNKKIIKIFSIIILMILCVNFYTITAKASEQITEGIGTGAIEKFKEGSEGELNDNNEAVKTTKAVISAVVSVVQVVSISVAVIMLMILAVKYMISSVADRAEIKKHAVVYVTGALIIFGVNGIIEIIQQFSKNIKY